MGRAPPHRSSYPPPPPHTSTPVGPGLPGKCRVMGGGAGGGEDGPGRASRWALAVPPPGAALPACRAPAGPGPSRLV